MKRVKIVLLAILFIAFYIGGFDSLVYADIAEHATTTTDVITTYYSISCVAFNPHNSSYSYIRHVHSFWSTFPSEATYFAPVYLPDSAKVTEFKVWFYDTNVSYDIQADFVRIRSDQLGPEEFLAGCLSSGSYGIQEQTDNTINYDVVDNSSYRYAVAVCFLSGDDTQRLLSMRITYELTSPWGIKEDQDMNYPSSELNIKAYPVPALGSTTIAYEVLQEGNVSLDIYNLLGEKVKTMVAGSQASGEYQVFWDGLDNKGNKLPAGEYFYRLETDGKTTTKKTVVLK